MSLQDLSSRAVIGRFYWTLEQNTGALWIPRVSMLFTSNQDSETYRWLGQSPAMREWVGGRQAKGFRVNGLTIANKHFEATVDIEVKDMRRDKTGQVFRRIDGLALRAQTHWASLLTTLIENGASAVCYDGQYFFDTDHAEGESGAQSNKISVDISALPTQAHGSTVAPSVEEMQQAILAGISQIIGFKDDTGEPMNEVASQFLVMVPTSLLVTARTAVQAPSLISGATNIIQASNDFQIGVVPNPRSTWTDRFAVFRTDGQVSAFIRQQETDVMLKVKAEGSEYEFDNDRHQYGIDCWRNVGYGYWQHAVQVIMT